MFDIWLKKNQQIVDEIIEESNLREIVKNKLDEFMQTEEFAQFLQEALSNEVKRNITKYAEYYMIGSDGWDEIEDKVKSIIVSHGESKTNKDRCDSK